MDEYFDAHTHLQMMKNISETIENARQTGVKNFICNSTGPNDWQTVLDISESYLGIHPCLGVHPHYVEKLPQTWFEQLRQLLIQNPKAMIGEIGLDKLIPDLDFQEKIFRMQLELAHELNRPVHIHCVRCWDRLLHILKTQRQKIPPKVLFHSHHGNKDLIPELIEKYNAYFSYSATFIPENHPKIQACLKSTPLDRLLIESDAPDLTPFPADIPSLVQKMSIISGHDISVLKKALYDNAMEFING